MVDGVPGSFRGGAYAKRRKESERKPMYSSMIGKIAKAKQYAQEPDRIQLSQFEATFRGENDNHTISFHEGTWKCDCNFFADHGACSHTLAAERVFGVSIPHDYRQGEPLASDSRHQL